MRNGTVISIIAFAACIGLRGNATEPNIKPAGMFIKESTSPGETRKDDVVPRHAVCVQASKTRWLIVYTTHGYRGVDDERSVLYQLRKDAPDGVVIKEGFLARAIADWRPAGVPAPPEGKSYFKQLGHAVAFGVPKGAVIDGKPAPHANAFVAQWRVLGRVLVNKENRLEKTLADPVLYEKTQDVEWMQFRLNDNEDDLEITQPIRKLRPRDTDRLPAAWMNQTFCPPIPFNASATEWVMCNHFEKGRIGVLKFFYGPGATRYGWVETSPLMDAGKRPLSEASIAKAGGEWLITARSNGQIAWMKTKNPFAADPPGWTFWKPPVVSAPHTMFLCADKTLRLFTGDSSASAQKYDRDPLYAWDIEHEAAAGLKNRRVVFDSLAEKLDMRRVVRPRVDFAILFPPHEKTQLLVYSVTPRAYNHPYEGTSIPPANAADKAASGLYFSRITYP
ncbi:MAG: hypothetical protein HYR84_03030, partial [Planctomycetes bacterium]|nr:hypothetical protein [Planctomycetota bacterium]